MRHVIGVSGAAALRPARVGDLTSQNVSLEWRRERPCFDSCRQPMRSALTAADQHLVVSAAVAAGEEA